MNNYPDYYVEFLRGENMILQGKLNVMIAGLKMTRDCMDRKWEYVGNE